MRYQLLEFKLHVLSVLMVLGVLAVLECTQENFRSTATKKALKNSANDKGKGGLSIAEPSANTMARREQSQQGTASKAFSDHRRL